MIKTKASYIQERVEKQVNHFKSYGDWTGLKTLILEVSNDNDRHALTHYIMVKAGLRWEEGAQYFHKIKGYEFECPCVEAKAHWQDYKKISGGFKAPSTGLRLADKVFKSLKRDLYYINDQELTGLQAQIETLFHYEFERRFSPFMI